MEIGLRDAYLEMMPQLEAEAELRDIQVAMAASGTVMRKEDRREYVRALRRTTGREQPAIRSLDGLAAMGIEVVTPSDD